VRERERERERSILKSLTDILSSIVSFPDSDKAQNALPSIRFVLKATTIGLGYVALTTKDVTVLDTCPIV